MNERILCLGSQGYLGWNIMMRLARLNNGPVWGVDSLIREQLVKDTAKSSSLTGERDPNQRLLDFRITFNKNNMEQFYFDIANKRRLEGVIKELKPTVILNYAQIPSAPYSMKDLESATYTTVNNTIGNLTLLWLMKEHCPNAHLIKMGTMGEYGQPNIDIEEGFIEIEHNGRKDTLPYPKQAGSFYHWAKVAESDHTRFACQNWDLRATDLMQGIVYGLHTQESRANPALLSRFDYDHIFGTVLNRFVTQMLANQDLTVYGGGQQTRGLIHIEDAIKCVELYIKNPPSEGEYRVFNQLCEQQRTVMELAEKVQEIGNKLGYRGILAFHPNPRNEKENHYYNVVNTKIKELGLDSHDLDKGIFQLFMDLEPFKDRIDLSVIKPTIQWK